MSSLLLCYVKETFHINVNGEIFHVFRVYFVAMLTFSNRHIISIIPWNIVFLSIVYVILCLQKDRERTGKCIDDILEGVQESKCC